MYKSVERGLKVRGWGARKGEVHTDTEQETLQWQNLVCSCFLHGCCENCNHGNSRSSYKLFTVAC